MRVDLYLYKHGYTRSRQKAQDLIAEKAVKIDGALIAKPSLDVDETAEHTVEIVETCPYVGRGGLKLDGAMQTFNLSVEGLTAMDIGASTGGFTDCLLRHGASRVFAIDSGYDQLAESLRNDPRVVNIERCNARNLSLETTGGVLCDFAVIDVSFISQTYILPTLKSVLHPGSCVVSLIKPQFEAGQTGLGKNGIVKNAAYRFLSVKRVLHTAEEHHLFCKALMRSPIKGGDGNVEYLALFILKGAPVEQSAVTDAMIKRITDKD